MWRMPAPAIEEQVVAPLRTSTPSRRRSRPPLGAIHSSLPPSFSSRSISCVTRTRNGSAHGRSIGGEPAAAVVRLNKRLALSVFRF